MPVVQVRDIEMYYQVHGQPDSEPLVLLHGFTATGGMFDQSLDQLGERYRLYVPDWRGHGRTTNSSDEIFYSELALDIVAFVAAMGLDRAHFCGQSAGGMLLTFLALEHSQLVHSLTYSASTYSFDDHVKSRVHEIATSATTEWIEGLRKSHGATHGDDYGHTIIKLWLDSTHRPNELPFTPDDLTRISCPTLIIHGDRDFFFPIRVPETMYKAIPDAELCILPQCDHLVPLEQPEMFTAALLQFLARHPMSAQ